MIAYASRTGTKRNLDALKGAGWRLMVSARGVWSTEGFEYALDNGAWTAHQKGEPFDVDAFRGAFERLGTGADFVVAPDVVSGGLASLRLSVAWLPQLTAARRVLIAVQDGMTPPDVSPLLNERVGLFLGGSTEWKLKTLPLWGQVARERGCYYHVGRVNTRRRIRSCALSGADSFDGSSVSRFAVTLAPLCAELNQGVLSCEW